MHCRNISVASRMVLLFLTAISFVGLACGTGSKSDAATQGDFDRAQGTTIRKNTKAWDAVAVALKKEGISQKVLSVKEYPGTKWYLIHVVLKDGRRLKCGLWYSEYSKKGNIRTDESALKRQMTEPIALTQDEQDKYMAIALPLLKKSKISGKVVKLEQTETPPFYSVEYAVVNGEQRSCTVIYDSFSKKMIVIENVI